MDKILVTGATGHLGSIVIEQLLKQTTSENIIALGRSEEKGGAILAKDVEVRIGDFDDITSLDKALEGIEKVLLISGPDPVNRLKQHKNVVDATVKSGAKHIVYTGVSLKDISTSANQFLMQSHFQTENYIKQSGLTYTFFRDNLYFDIIPMYGGEHVFETGITAPAGEGKTAFALRSDIGEALAKVLIQAGHHNKTYDITGSQSYSFAEIAQTLSKLSGKNVAFNDVPVDAYSKQLKTFSVPNEFIAVLVDFATDIKNGQHELVSNDLEELLKRKPADLEQSLKEIYGL